MARTRHDVLDFVSLLVLTILASACGGPSPTEAVEEDLRIDLAIPAGSLRGQRLEVRILGTGFDSGAVATWERDGVVDPNIVVNSTKFIDSTELVADIAVAPAAVMGLFDIGVTKGKGRKKGTGVEKKIGIDLFKVAGGMMLEGAFQTEEGPQWVDTTWIGPTGNVFVLYRQGHGDAFFRAGDPFFNGGVHFSQDFAQTTAAGVDRCNSDPADMSAAEKAALFSKLRHNPGGYPRQFVAQVDLLTLGMGADSRNAMRSAWKETDGTLLGVGITSAAVTRLSSREYRWTAGEVGISHTKDLRAAAPGAWLPLPPLLSCPNLDTVVVTWPWQ